MPYGVYVAMPEPAQSCFVVMPYGDQDDDTDSSTRLMEATYSAILEALAGVGLIPERADKLYGTSTDFVEDIFSRARSAKVILVDCSPEDDTGQPNPNVMYELGLAHALGRPTVIITANPDRLPANIKSKVAVGFKNTDTAALAELSRNLQLALKRVLDRVGEWSVDPDWNKHGVYQVRAHYKVCLDPQFLRHFGALVEFASNIRHLFQPVDNETPHFAGYLEEMSKAPGEIDSAQMKRLDASWIRYKAAHGRIQEQIYKPGIEAFMSKYDQAMQFMSSQALEPTLAITAKKSSEYYAYIKNVIRLLPQSHKEVTNNYESKNGDIAMFRDMESISELASLVRRQYILVNGCVQQSHSLVFNMVSVFREL